MENTKFTIEITYPLKKIKVAYRKHYGISGKVTKKQVTDWLSDLVEADIENDMV